MENGDEPIDFHSTRIDSDHTPQIPLRPRRIGRWFGPRGSYIDGPGVSMKKSGSGEGHNDGKTWENIYVLYMFC